jgi:hypothetical protein
MNITRHSLAWTRIGRLFGALTIAFVLTGCLDYETTVLVRADGSGTVTESILVRGSLKTALEKKTPSELAASPAAVAKKITELGGQVRVLSNEGIKEDQRVGHRTVYAFDDINALILPLGDLSKKKDNAILDTLFRFSLDPPKPDSPAILHIHASHSLIDDMTRSPTAEEKKAFEEKQKDPKFRDNINTALQLMKALSEDMRVSLRVQLEPGIATSNALYHDENSIDLLTIDFRQLWGSSEFNKLLTQFQQGHFGEPMTREAALALRMPGWRVELQKDIDARFK